MDPLPKLTESEFLVWWDRTINAFSRDILVVDCILARQTESLAIATYTYGRRQRR